MMDLFSVLDTVYVWQSHVAVPVVTEHPMHEVENLFTQMVCANFFQIPLRKLFVVGIVRQTHYMRLIAFKANLCLWMLHGQLGKALIHVRTILGSFMRNTNNDTGFVRSTFFKKTATNFRRVHEKFLGIVL
jgi:hypothetical protein